MNILDLYSSLVNARALLPREEDDIEGSISHFKTLINNNVIEIGPDDVNQYYGGLCSAIYGLIDSVRNKVDDLYKISFNHIDNHGISNSSKTKVLLLGETSAGKTTFLQRIFGEDCGKTGPTPITAFTVIHETTKQGSYIKVIFKPRFSVPDDKKEGFEQFLKTYNLFRDFKEDDGQYTFASEIIMDNKDKFTDFLYEANSYPFAFDEITWFHKSSKKQIDFVKYATIYDLPGTGGQEEHNQNIESALKRYGNNIDVILYLIKTDQGIPSNYEILKTLRKQILEISSKPDFYFVYQINQNSNKSSFKELSSRLKEYIEKDTDSGAINPFDENEKYFYLNSRVIDARGDIHDRIHANIALATVIQNYYQDSVEEFLSNVSISKVPWENDLLKPAKTSKQEVNSSLDDFFSDWSNKRGEDGKLPAIEEIKEDFLNQYGLKENYKEIESLPHDLQHTISYLRLKIENDYKEIFNYLKVSPKMFDLRPSDSSKTKFDKTKYEECFAEEYLLHENWQSLIYNIQTYHWLRLNNSGTLTDIYAKASAEPVKNHINEYLDRLRRLKNEIPVVADFNENNDF